MILMKIQNLNTSVPVQIFIFIGKIYILGKPLISAELTHLKNYIIHKDIMNNIDLLLIIQY